MQQRLTRTVAALLGALATACALALAPAALASASAAPALRTAPLNPEFVLWQAQRGFRQALAGAGLHGFGERPAPHAVVAAGPAAPADLTYATSFDLRTQGRLTPVRNQGAFGTCWSFATYGSLESMLMPGASADFSEDNLVLTNGFDTGATAEAKYDHGGNFWYSSAYLTRWGGPVLESQDGYGDGATPGGLTPAYHVQDVTWYAPRASATDNDGIKYALTTSGAVYVSMSWQGSTNSTSAYYNATTHAYYYGGSASTNHAVVVVGWDDGYAASNFSTTPAGNGAFIVRNSWGSGWGEGGYFYVSYYDAQFARAAYDYAVTFDGVETAGNYDVVYQHDPLGDISSIGYGAGAPVWGANRFTATADGSLRAVAFYAEAPNTAYEVWEGPSTASLSRITSGTLPQMGFHTVTLPTTPAVTSGGAFVVAIKLTNASYGPLLPVEYPVANYSSQAEASAGESYYSSNGSSWNDLTTWNAGANLCLKAYTTATAPATLASASGYAFAADPSSGWKTTGQSVTVTASGGTGSRTIHFSKDGGATWSAQAGNSATFTVPGEGSHHVEYYATTATETEEVHDAGYVNIDSVAPATRDDHLTLLLAAPATITLRPADATSGMGGTAKTEYKVDGAGSYTTGTSVVLVAGTHTVAYRSTDAAGNVETPDKSFTVTVAAEGAAASSCSYAFAPDARSPWARTPQTLDFAAGGFGADLAVWVSLDGGVSWKQYPGSSCSVLVGTQGAHHVLFYAKDSLTQEAAHDAGWVNIDSGRPRTTASAAAVRKGARVTLKFRANDPVPGCGRAVMKLQIRRRAHVVTTIPLGTRWTNTALRYRYLAKLKAGTYTYRIVATDIAGNTQVRMTAARLLVR
jgi:C1A family cysteine protease